MRQDDEITCPYCGHEVPNSCDRHDGMEDGDEKDMECSKCGKSFTMILNVAISYVTRRLDCEGSHVWGPKWPSVKRAGVFFQNCENCEQGREVPNDDR